MMGQLEFIIGCYRALPYEANTTAGGYSKIGAKTNGGTAPREDRRLGGGCHV
jgi:hypothetical protein